MCLAIYKPAKLGISEEYLRNAWQGNSDGAGFAFVRSNKVVIEKGFMIVKDFLAAYEAAYKANKRSPFLIHFRIRTQGDKSQDNTHPFPIKSGALIHNGGLDGTGAAYHVGKSDTCLFAERLADKLSYDAVSSRIKELSDAVGYNKIAMLYDNGKHVILNEGGGHWHNDVWFSNHSYSYTRRNFSGHSGHSGPYGMME